MTEDQDTEVERTPWHLWVIGIVGLLWSAMGAMDYVMTKTKNEAYMSNFTPEQLAFFYGIPDWAVATWAIAVWGGVVGAILLLFKQRHAVTAFLASLIGLVITAIQNYALSNGMDVMGDAFSLAFTAAIFVVSIALYLYARTMLKRNILT